MNQPQQFSANEIAKELEPLIRRIIREKLTRIAQKEPDIFHALQGYERHQETKSAGAYQTAFP